MNITLLTAETFINKVKEDELLIEEFRRRGHLAQIKTWENLVDEGEDLFIVRSTWNYTNHLNQFLENLKSIQERLWNPYPLIEWNSNKKYLLELEQKDLQVLPLKLAHDSLSLNQAIQELGGKRFVAKPFVGASAVGIKCFDKENLPDLSHEMIIQKFYPEIEQGEVSLLYFNNNFSHAVRKIPKQGDFRVQSEYEGTTEKYSPTMKDLLLAESVLKHIPTECLYVRVDLIPGLGLIELECIEPGLFLEESVNGVNNFVDAVEGKRK